MKTLAAVLVIVTSSLLLPALGNAKGCLKGAAVGGVAGHVAGHHAVAGAAVGCVVQHHREKVRDRAAAQQPAQPAQRAPQPAQPATLNAPLTR